MQIHGTLESIHSKRDVYGNCYWALRYTDNATGRVVVATVSGGESNISAIRLGFSKPDEWDSGIATRTDELKIREFNRLTKNWQHAGCNPDDLREFIKRGIAAK